MPIFLQLTSVEEAKRIILQNIPYPDNKGCIVQTQDALGRIVTESVTSPQDLPEFSRSTVDGYAVQAKDTFGINESMPGYLRFIGEVPMGKYPELSVSSGQCALIHTGGLIPSGADAVVMLEHSQRIEQRSSTAQTSDLSKDRKRELNTEGGEIEIYKSVTEGENVIQPGEDIRKGQIVLNTGERINPALQGACMALGITELRVATIPAIGIISSGDEIVDPYALPEPGQFRDVNSYMLSSAVSQFGCRPLLYGIVKDDLDVLIEVARKALGECEGVLITAGSSASERDQTVEAIRKLGAPGVLVHGINIKPGKPTILAVCDGKPVIGMPGNPVSAFVIATVILKPILETLIG
ncbi:MAG: molybdopterin molybdotransferase MoeA, partial [Candidatus Methanomethylicus sp.]|nr:molybdopterin molybdotransferase MoeA [Candidatus Methanomethylicus sp.]